MASDRLSSSAPEPGLRLHQPRHPAIDPVKQPGEDNRQHRGLKIAADRKANPGKAAAQSRRRDRVGHKSPQRQPSGKPPLSEFMTTMGSAR